MKGIYYLLGAAIAVIAVAFLVSSMFPPKEGYSVSLDGFLSYTNRPAVVFSESLYNDSGQALVRKITIQGRAGDIFGLYSVPKAQQGQRPAFILLPAQSVEKEGEHRYMGALLNSMGIITLALDLRGQGESRAVVKSVEQDYADFKEGEEPYYHASVYEALKAYDFLGARPEVNQSAIFVLGESMGGRTGIIAAAIEPGIRGYMGVSTSGYGFLRTTDEDVNRFLFSIDPARYLGRISPRKAVFIHSREDPVIKVSSARELYSKANDPKDFITLQSSFHGYYKPNAELEDGIKKAVEWVLK